MASADSFAAESRRLWKAVAPDDYAQIEDKDEFFRLKGEEALAAWNSMTSEMTRGKDLSEDYWTRVGQIGAIEDQVREIIREEYLMPPGDVRAESLDNYFIDLPLRDPYYADRAIDCLCQVMKDCLGGSFEEFEALTVPDEDYVEDESVARGEWDGYRDETDEETIARLKAAHGGTWDSLLDFARAEILDFWASHPDLVTTRRKRILNFALPVWTPGPLDDEEKMDWLRNICTVACVGYCPDDFSPLCEDDERYVDEEEDRDVLARLTETYGSWQGVVDFTIKTIENFWSLHPECDTPIRREASYNHLLPRAVQEALTR